MKTSTTHNSMAYFCYHSSLSTPITEYRLTLMLYLADWFSAITYNEPFTELPWKYDHGFLYTKYLDNIIKDMPSLYTVESSTLGVKGREIYFDGDINKLIFTEGEKQILDHILKETKDLLFNSLVKQAYSTYPMTADTIYTDLDLVALAKEWKNKNKRI